MNNNRFNLIFPFKFAYTLTYYYTLVISFSACSVGWWLMAGAGLF
jgi:hypothetical protein